MMNFLNLPVNQYDNLRHLDNAQYWVIAKNKYGKYRFQDDIFLDDKDEEYQKDAKDDYD